MIHGPPQDRLEINLTPLLDLVLQLIMFFMLTVSLVNIDKANAGVDLPVAQSAMPLGTTGDNHVSILVGKSGERSVDGAPLRSAVALRDYLKVRQEEIRRRASVRQLTGPADIIVVVRADKDASWGAVWETLDECSRAGCHRWQLRVVKQAV